MSSLQNQYVDLTYTYVLQIPGALSGSLVSVQDGAGSSSILQLSTSAVNINGTFKVAGYTMTFPAAASTIVSLDAIQTLSNKTFVAPILGTPTSGTLTNCTGLPISTGVSGLGTNVATMLATFSSANIASACTDETGSGALVFATSPTFVTPTLGAASATSINKVALTAPASSATLTIADGKVLTASNTLTFTGTDSSTVACGTGGTVLYTSNAAAQSDQETGSSTTTFVSPGRQQYHPSAAKAWARWTTVTSTTITASYGVSSLTDNGAGDTDVNFTTAFSSNTSYGGAVTTVYSGAHSSIAVIGAGGHTTTKTNVVTYVTNALDTPADLSIVFAAFYGDV